MNAIQNLRNSISLSQADFAKAVGISQSAISQIERNLMRPKPDVAKKLISFAKKNNAKLSFEDIYK